MNILEEYKKKAAKLRQDMEQSNTQGNELHQIRNMQVVTALQQIHAYLHDLIEQLNFVDPDIRCNFSLGPFGELTNLRQGDYKLLYESSYNKETVNLSFALNNEEQIDLEIEENENTKQQLDKLKNQGLLANFVARQPPKINIQGYVPVRLEFSSDFDDTSILVALHNYSQFEDANYKVYVNDVNEQVLNDLGAFILRQENRFMEILSEDSQAISIMKSMRLGTSSDGPETEEMDASRLRSLFNREHRLFLTYHNVIKDVGTRTQGFILGRAKDCDLAVNTELASRHHAQLVFRKGKFVLIDQSTNGTFVKTQGGKEVYVQSEALPLSGSGFISLGKAVSVDNEHLIYYSCQ
ncbi:MAG: FHA domain-containing protein [Gammaproteobacteria bacterium]|nr:FHA domain-containing protein [Gammaproteobacteria bacterium]